jgi:hypothetical protein
MCFKLLRDNVSTQQRHRTALATAVSSRRAALFTAWRSWAAEQRQLAETLDVALERKRLRCLSSFLHQWRTNAHNTSLLRRVFTAACDSWRSSLGAAGYEADFSLLSQCFAAWQIAAHVQREERRDGALDLAAESTRERSLLATAFTALRKEAEWATEKESYLPLAHASLLSWREATLTSRSHMASLAAQQHYEDNLKKKVLTVWSGYATVVACRVSVFYVKWQLDERRRAVISAWRNVIAERQKWESRRAEAEILRNKHSSPGVDSIQAVGAAVTEIVVDVQSQQRWLTPISQGAGTTPSTGARSVTPVQCGSSESWHAKAAEWRRRQEFYTTGALVSN